MSAIRLLSASERCNVSRSLMEILCLDEQARAGAPATRIHLHTRLTGAHIRVATPSAVRGSPQRRREEKETVHVRAASVWTKMAGGTRADWPNGDGGGVENARSTAVNRPTIKIKISRRSERLRGREREREKGVAREWGFAGLRTLRSYALLVGRDCDSERGQPRSVGAKDFFMDLSLSPSRALVALHVRVRVRVSAGECHASARARSAIVIKGDANWWQSEVRPKARASRPGTLRFCSPNVCARELARLCLAEVPEIPDLANA